MGRSNVSIRLLRYAGAGLAVVALVFLIVAASFEAFGNSAILAGFILLMSASVRMLVVGEAKIGHRVLKGLLCSFVLSIVSFLVAELQILIKGPAFEENNWVLMALLFAIYFGVPTILTSTFFCLFPLRTRGQISDA